MSVPLVTKIMAIINLTNQITSRYAVGAWQDITSGPADSIQEKNLVEFRLLYQGELLPSAGSQKRAEEKHRIRRAFHPQLRHLWYMQPNLRQLAMRWYEKVRVQEVKEEEKFEYAIKAMGKNWNRYDMDFVPLVTEAMVLQCSLDILLLRPAGKKYIYEQGDIDGQLKTLFDALRMPQDGEVKDRLLDDEEIPLFCLLEDDRLINEVKITADKLLLLPQQREVKANDAFVLIHVRLNHNPTRTFDNFFG
jgi:hypothetical protein